jgi:hypothetical protein
MAPPNLSHPAANCPGADRLVAIRPSTITLAISLAHLRPAGSARRGCVSIERKPEPQSDAAFRNASHASASAAVPPFAELETKELCATPSYPRLVLR